MRKTGIFLMVIATVGIIFATATAAKAKIQIAPEAAEQTLLRLLAELARNAIEDYYGERRQYWRDEILRVQKVPNSAFYLVVMRVETFYGPHNPPYGFETMTFYIGYGKVRLEKFEHQDEPG